MSNILGRLVTCDRCGKESFEKRIETIELDEGFTRFDTFKGLKDWGRHHNKDLCPDCYKEWNKIETDFMNKEKAFFKGV